MILISVCNFLFKFQNDLTHMSTFDHLWITFRILGKMHKKVHLSTLLTLTYLTSKRKTIGRDGRQWWPLPVDFLLSW